MPLGQKLRRISIYIYMYVRIHIITHVIRYSFRYLLVGPGRQYFFTRLRVCLALQGMSLLHHTWSSLPSGGLSCDSVGMRVQPTLSSVVHMVHQKVVMSQPKALACFLHPSAPRINAPQQIMAPSPNSFCRPSTSHEQTHSTCQPDTHACSTVVC